MATQLKVPFKASGFPSGIPRSGTLSFTRSELAHALFTTGRAPGDQRRFGPASTLELIHRTSVIGAYLQSTPTGSIHKSALAEFLDGSEKAGLSYALGQAMTSIYCRQQLKVTYLMHVDRYQHRYDVSFGSGRGRPDLFGLTLSGDWIVAEAKGRSNRMESSLLAKLTAQKSMIKSINGRKPSLALGCVSSFPAKSSGSRNSLHLDVVDPPAYDDAMEIDINLSRFVKAYYEPFLTAIAAGVRVEDVDGYVVSELPGVGLRLGLLPSIHDLVTGDDPVAIDHVAAVLDAQDAHTRQGEGAFPDGTFVQAVWEGALAFHDDDA